MPIGLREAGTLPAVVKVRHPAVARSVGEKAARPVGHSAGRGGEASEIASRHLGSGHGEAFSHPNHRRYPHIGGRPNRASDKQAGEEDRPLHVCTLAAVPKAASFGEERPTIRLRDGGHWRRPRCMSY
jgi:hypothetical protein